MFEDIKEAFPNKSIEWGLHVLNKYLKPETKLRDIDRGVEVWMEMDVVEKIAPIAEKYGFVRPEQRTALAMKATAVATKNEMREEYDARINEIEERLKKQIVQQLKSQTIQTSSEGAAPIPRALTWEEEKKCFRGAVLRIMELKNKKGDLIFFRNAHWKAVYRFVVDMGLNYDIDDPNMPHDSSTLQCKEFDLLAKELQFDVNPPTRIPFTRNAIKDINKDSYKRYNAPFINWSLDGLKDIATGKILNPKGYTLYKELWVVYKTLEKAYDYRYYIAATAKP